MFTSGYSSRQSMQDRSSTWTGASSSARSSRPQQTLPGEGYAPRTTDLRDITGYDSELGHLLSPPSPPPSLDQIFAGEPNSSSSQRPIATPNSSDHYQNIYNIYDDIERELLAEPSSSPQQPNTGAIPTPPHSNSRYQSLYDGFAQALSNAPTSSRQQSVANESASTTTPQNSRYRGVCYNTLKGKWHARWVDPTQGRRVFIGGFDTQNEAIDALNSYKASRGNFFQQATNPPGLYRIPSGRWTVKYRYQGAVLRVGTFDTKEQAERALRKHRAARGLPRAMASRRQSTCDPP